jgi:phage protein D
MPVVAIRASQMSQFRVIFPDRGKYGAVMARYHDLALGKQLTVLAGNGEPVLELPVVHASAAEAQNIADSRYRAMQRGQATFTFATVGDPAMQAEAKLMVSGMGERIDGEWVVESVQHRIGGQGYTCTGTATRGVADESDSGDFED